MQKTITLPEQKVVFHVANGRPVVQIPVGIIFQYFEREDTPEGAPLKLTVKVGINTWYELSLTISQGRSLAYFLGRVVRARGKLGGQVSD